MGDVWESEVCSQVVARAVREVVSGVVKEDTLAHTCDRASP
jgi:hypothetical protein